MNDPRNINTGADQTPAPGGATKKAEKVRSSRYEWETKSEGNDNSSAAGAAPGASLMASLGRWLKRLFSDGRGFFDNDDDATPSAA